MTIFEEKVFTDAPSLYLVNRDGKRVWVEHDGLGRNELAGWHRRLNHSSSTIKQTLGNANKSKKLNGKKKKRSKVHTIAKITKKRLDVNGNWQYFVYWSGSTDAWWVEGVDVDEKSVEAFESGDWDGYWATEASRLADKDVDANYDARTVLSRPQGKDQANRMVARAISGSGLATGKVAYLESERGYTTAKFDESCPPDMVLIPVNMSQPVCNKITCSLPDRASVRCMVLSDYIADADPLSHAAIWNDACATWRGASGSGWAPRADTYAIIDAHLIVPSGVLGVTVCLRDMRNKGVGAFKRTTKNVRENVLRRARRSGYKGTKTVTEYVYGNMLLLIFRMGKL